MPRRERHRYSLIQRWREPDDPLPVRVIQPTRPYAAPLWHQQRAELQTVQASEPFDFGANMQRLVMDIAVRVPDFRHLKAPRILVTATQSRGETLRGLQARVTPLRFPGGTLTRKRRGVPYHIQRYFLGDHEYLYLMTFCLPRFLEQDFDSKFVTLFHELYHIGPAFDGDLRRHDGRCHMHTHSQREYNQSMVQYAREYLESKPDPQLHSFLRLDFAQLRQRHGAVVGIVVPRPKIIPLVAPYVT